MSDLASQPLNPDFNLTSMQKRYREIASRLPMITPPARTPDPTASRIDDGPSTTTLAAKRTKAEDEARAGLLHPVADGAVVRTDEGNGDEANPSEEVRLNFAKALLAKAEGASPAEAERLANAGTAKGGEETGDWPLSRRAQHEDPRTCRC
jgi:hypothetical protein